jgi:predicted ATPase
LAALLLPPAAKTQTVRSSRRRATCHYVHMDSSAPAAVANLARTARVTAPATLTRIIVVGLHGRYDYDLDLVPPRESEDRLALLYGENGSGKTTLLRLLWDLLSPSPSSGHRSRISKVVFTRFEVQFSNGHSIAAQRKLPVSGPYEIEIRKRKRLFSKSAWPDKSPYEEYFGTWSIADLEEKTAQFEPEIRKSAEETLEQKRFLQFVESLGSAPYFLADDRTTSSDSFPNETIARGGRARLSEAGDDSKPSSLALELDKSIKRANEMLRQMSIGGTASGSQNANTVYMDVLRQIGASSERLQQQESALDSREKFVRKVADLGERSKSFEELGLTPKFVSAEFLRAIRRVPAEQLPMAISIVDPYIESLTARLNALQNAETVLRTFLGETNRFLTDKELTFSPAGGLRIRLADGQHLQARQLSSGECHLLLLLCNALLAREGSTLFIVDEPELSLNVKWQRRVLRALLACTDGTNVQFLVATHSIELLSAYRANVVQVDAESVHVGEKHR